MRLSQSWASAVVALVLAGGASADVLSDGIRMLKDKDPGVRSMGAKELARMGPKAAEAIPDLISVLGDTRSAAGFTGSVVTPRVRQFVSGALVSIGPKAIPALRDAMLINSDEEIRLGAVRTITNLIGKGDDDKIILDALSKATGDKNTNVRRYAVQGLGRLGHDEAGVLPRLTKVLKADPDEWVRYETITALEQVDPDGGKIISPLTDALRDQSPDVMGAAAGALGRLGEKAKASVPALMAVLDDTRDRFEAMAPDAIGMRPVRCDAAEALGRIGQGSLAVLPALKARLARDPDGFFRVSLALAVLRIDPRDEQAIPEIIKILAGIGVDEERGLLGDGQYRAFEAVMELGPRARATLPVLLKLLTHKISYIRERAAEALGEVGDESVLPNLVDAHNDPEAEVREAADKAMKRVRGRKQ